MKILSFINVLFFYGSLFNKPFDFFLFKKNAIKDLPFKVKSGKPLLFRQTKVHCALFNIKAFLAYLKNCYNRNQSVLPFFNTSYYLRIPKCGSTTINYNMLINKFPELENYSLDDDQIDILADELLEKRSIKNAHDKTIFTVVRNPLHRLLSAYLNIYSASEFIYHSYLFGIFKPSDDFKMFVEKISKIPTIFQDQNFRTQTSFIKSKHIVIFKLEDGLEKLVSLMNQYPKFISLKLNETNYSKNWWEYYDKETFHTACKIYKEDIEKFGYKEEINKLRKNFQ